MRKILKKKSKNTEKVAEEQKNGAKVEVEAVVDSSDESTEENYEVQKIVDSKIENNVCFYLIRWKGYSSEDDTWEAEDKIDAPDAITAFKKRNDKTEKKISKKKIDDISHEENDDEGSESHPAIKKSNNKTPKKKTLPKKRANSSGKSNASNDDVEEWEVAKIVDMVEEDGERLFRIRWKNFSAKDDTWEPESNLSCGDLIKKYLVTEKRPSTKDIEPKDLRDNRRTTDRYETNNFSGRASRRQHGKLRKVYYDAE